MTVSLVPGGALAVRRPTDVVNVGQWFDAREPRVMNTKVTNKNSPVVMAAACAVAFPLVVKFVGDNSWAFALLFVPIAGGGTYIGCRMGQWWFGGSRRG